MRAAAAARDAPPDRVRARPVLLGVFFGGVCGGRGGGLCAVGGGGFGERVLEGFDYGGEFAFFGEEFSPAWVEVGGLCEDECEGPRGSVLDYLWRHLRIYWNFCTNIY